MAPSLRLVSRIFQVIFAFALAYFALRLLHYHLASVTFPFPIAFRESAMMSSTDALVKGLNPYDMSLQPQYMNEYGIIYPLLAWPWAKIFGTTMLIHRVITAFSILGCCVLAFFVLKKMAVPVLLNIWAVLMLYSSLLFPGTSTATIDPGATGTFFFLLTLFIPWFCQYSYKSLIVSVLFGILAFYTKMYTFLGALVMLSYLFLFVSKMKSLFYFFVLLPLLIISIGVINQIFPAYFDNCFFSEVNMAPAWASMERLHTQIITYRDLHQWVFILMGIFILGYILKNISVVARSPKGDEAISFKRLLRFARSDIGLALYAGLCSSLVLYMSMGRNSGAFLWYFFQLLSPFLLIGAAWIFSRSSFWPLLCVPFLIYNLYTMTSDQNYKYFNKNTLSWVEVSLLVNQHQHILDTSLIAPLLIEQNKEVLNNGQTEYFQLGGERNYWMKGWLKEDARVYIQQLMFFGNIRNRVENKKFDLIMLPPTLLPLGIGDDIKKYYKYDGYLLVYAPQDHRPYEISVWRPL